MAKEEAAWLVKSRYITDIEKNISGEEILNRIIDEGIKSIQEGGNNDEDISIQKTGS